MVTIFASLLRSLYLERHLFITQLVRELKVDLGLVDKTTLSLCYNRSFVFILRNKLLNSIVELKLTKYISLKLNNIRNGRMIETIDFQNKRLIETT